MKEEFSSNLLAPRHEILQNQQFLFQELLHQAWKHSAFYRDYYESHGIRRGELRDVTVRDLPFLSKKLLMENFDRIVTDSRLCLWELERWLNEERDPRQHFGKDFIVMHSSGSSGTMGIFVYSRKDWQIMNSTMATRLPPPENSSGKTRVAFYRAAHGHFAGVATAVHLSKSVYDTLIVSVLDPIDRVVEELNRFQPHRLTGYSSSIAPLAESALAGKLQIVPQTVFVSGDILLPSVEQRIREAWGVPIYNLYGASESLFLGVQETSQKEMLLMDDLNIYEILDTENRPVKPGKQGRVAITNLYNYTLPLLRYELGDRVTQGASQPTFGFSTILGILPGKDNDSLPVLLDNGELGAISSRVLTSFYSPGLQRVQFVLEDTGSIRIDYVAPSNIDVEMRNEFRRILDFQGASRIIFKVRQVPVIEADRVTGKVRLVVLPKKGSAGKSFFSRLNESAVEPPQIGSTLPKHCHTPFNKPEIEQSIATRFERMVHLYRQRIAVKCGVDALTYGELNRAANRVAQVLLDTRGEKNEPIALLLEHGILAVAAILGVLKAGKFYVPLDSTYPQARLSSIVRDSETRLILTNDVHMRLARVLLPGVGQTLSIDGIEPVVSDQNPDIPIAPDALAYLFYTSGSTGQPKGVTHSQRNVLHQIMTYTHGLHLSSRDHLTMLHSYGFSASRLDIFGALLNGAALHLFSIVEQGMEELAQWLADEEISIFHWVPPAFRLFCEVPGRAQEFPKLRLIVLGSSPLLPRDVLLFQKHFSDRSILVNRFGTTETGNIRWFFMDKRAHIPKQVVPVGYPIEDMEVLILDELGRKLGNNQIGEIAVKSHYLSDGYWRKPELTREAFSSDGLSEARIYRTGDLGKMLPDGCLLHLGRKDFQVKIRSHRVELGEIERVLLAHSEVRETVVVTQESTSEDQELLAYLVGMQKRSVPTGAELRQYLEARLPAYMIPSTFVFLEILPRTLKGKLDRRNLPKPVETGMSPGSPPAKPRNETEMELIKIWRALFNQKRIGIHDDFFELGGDSMIAMRIISRVSESFKIAISFRSFFDLPTVAHIADLIGQERNKAPKTK